jgi:Trypsin-like peptidase domain
MSPDAADGDSITIGNITGATGVAIGRGAQAQVTQEIHNYDLAAQKDDPNIADMLQPNPAHFRPPKDSSLAADESIGGVSAEEVFEAIIGSNEIVDHGVVAGLVELGRSVARIRVRGHENLTKVPPQDIASTWQNLDQNGQLKSFVGTGWIFGPARKVILTNHHVFPLPAAAKTASLEFEYQRDLLRNTTSKGYTTRLDPDQVFFTSPTMKFGGLDYALVALREQAPPELGFLDFSPDQTAELASLVYVVQHPGGDPKAYVVNHNRKINLSDNYLTYSSDTRGGSSGSPLFDETLKLIGIHHIGNFQVEINGQKLFTNLGSRLEVVEADLTAQIKAAGWDDARVEEWFGDGSVLQSFRQANN